jgi:hypothetical protein
LITYKIGVHPAGWVRDTNVGVQRIGLLSWQSGCGNSNQAKEQRMSEPSLRELEEQRDRLYARLAATGDFRRGSVTENYRRCGKVNCACAQPGHPGHGPRFLWTRSVPGSGTRGRQLAPGEVEKVRRELAGYQQFAALTEQIVEVNEAICEARPAAAPAAGDPPGPQQPDGEKGGSGHGSRRRRPPR